MKIKRMIPYFKTLNLSFQSQIEYKANFVMSFIFKLLPVLVNILIWISVNVSEQSNMTQSDIITYYCISLITTNLVTCFIQNEISQDICNGDICKYMIKPINYIFYQFFKDLAHRLIFIILGIIPVSIIFLLFHRYINLVVNFTDISLFILSIIVGYLINYLFCFIISELSFYFTNVTALFSSFDVLKNIVSGAIFPLNLLSASITGFLLYLPFSYITFLPTIILQKKYSISFIFEKMTIGLLWIVILFLIARFIWKKGIERYTTFGG